MTHILVDDSGAPVPLPFHTVDVLNKPRTVTSFDPALGCCIARSNGTLFWMTPHRLRLSIITEAEYMEKQS